MTSQVLNDDPIAIETPKPPIETPSTTEVPAPAAAEERIDWIDVGRVAAIIAVIAIHVSAPLVIRTDHPTSWWVGNLVESAARWCVPLFVMISGALLLASPRTADAGPFYRRRFARLAPALVVWTVAYLIFGYVTTGIPRDIGEAFRSVLAGRPHYHLYFLFVIAGLYVVAPGLRLIVERLDKRGLAIATAMAFGLAIGDVIIQYLGGGGGPNALTRWLPFVGFFLAGALFREAASTARRIRVAAAIAFVGIAATAVGTAALVGPLGFGLARGRYLYENQSITTVPVSLAVFGLLVWLGPGLSARMSVGARALVASAAAASFGIYLIHPMILVGLSAVGVEARATIAPIAVAVTIAAAFVISWAIVLVVHRLPVLRTLV